MISSEQQGRSAAGPYHVNIRIQEHKEPSRGDANGRGDDRHFARGTFGSR